MKQKRIFATAITLLVGSMIFATSAQAAVAGKTSKGPKGQTLTVSATSVTDGQVVKVTGKKYDKKIGIYLAFCVVNAKGVSPGPCGGGANLTGTANSSIWISSNAPSYGDSLAIPFSKSGGFKQEILVSRYIGATDCAIVKCAIVTRADHTKSSYRKADVIIPVKFKN